MDKVVIFKLKPFLLPTPLPRLLRLETRMDDEHFDFSFSTLHRETIQ